MRDICAYLGGRQDKNFLGSGNLGLVIEPSEARLIFAQQWLSDGILDWAAGVVRGWSPDRITLQSPAPVAGAQVFPEPSARWVCMARNDVLGLVLEWHNATDQECQVAAVLSGSLPGAARVGNPQEAGLLYAAAAYSQRLPELLYLALAASHTPRQIELHGQAYAIHFEFSLAPHATQRLTLLLGVGLDQAALDQALRGWAASDDLLETVRQDWNGWFEREIPGFQASDPFFEKLYYYRWWSLYTKMIFARVGHLLYPAPREGTVAFEGLVSYSGACISVDELRWMRKPDWAISTIQTFFAPENLNDGYLANHIWDWGIDGDESNLDSTGRSVPYQNYAVAALYGALLVHPPADQTLLAELWPRLCSNLDSYPRLFDIDQDGLYETYPWSNSAGQEWGARFLYFDPLPEIFRYERGRSYAPDGTRAQEDLDLARKIRQAVVTDPGLSWPETPAALYRLYFGTRDHRLATVDQSTYAYRNFSAAARLAVWLGDTVAEYRYAQLARRTAQQINDVLWDAQEAFFYDVQPITHRPARVKSVTGFYPFWARIAGRQHLPILRHLFHPATFWSAFPLPSLPLDYEKYAQIQQAGWTYWNYCTWPRSTCHVVDGLLWAAKALDPALTDQAARLLEKYTRMHFLGQDPHMPNIAERYDPHTGEPFGANLDYNHSSWIDLLMQHVAGLTPQEGNAIVIDPVDMGWESFSFTNIRFRGHDLDLEYVRGRIFAVRVDGRVQAEVPGIQRLVIEP